MDTPTTGAKQADADSDLEAVTRLLGRTPSGAFTVVTRRPDGSPVVIENDPVFDDGRPMPTLFWLVDRELSEAVSRLEASGGVRLAAAETDPLEVESAHSRYAAQRDAKIREDHEGPRPSGGVGGTRKGVKCLHAHLAWFLAGGNDPVGNWVAESIGVDASKFKSDNAGGGV